MSIRWRSRLLTVCKVRASLTDSMFRDDVVFWEDAVVLGRRGVLRMKKDTVVP